jgi:hypothetical protein
LKRKKEKRKIIIHEQISLKDINLLLEVQQFFATALPLQTMAKPQQEHQTALL